MGRFCEHKSSGPKSADEFDSFDEYAVTLELDCEEGVAGTFTWTPDESTPDTVYFQV